MTTSAVVPTSTHIERLDTWESEFSNLDKVKFGALMQKMGIPFQVIEVVLDLWDITEKVGNKIYNIGKILACKIIEFVQRNPNMVLGMALGAAAGVLTSMIPWIGPILAPFVTIITALNMGISGLMIDLQKRGESVDSTFQAIIAAAKEFFQLLIETYKAIKESF